MSDNVVTPAFYDVTWAASRLDLSEDTVRRMANRGDLPHHRAGRRLRFTEQDITDYLAMTAVPARGMGRSKPKTRRAS